MTSTLPNLLSPLLVCSSKLTSWASQIFCKEGKITSISTSIDLTPRSDPSLSPEISREIDSLPSRLFIEKGKEGTETETAEEQEPVAVDGVSESKVELSELGAEMKKALQERKEEAEGNISSGVAKEVREIEGPVFGKVLGTTGVVLGVIAGSSVVLVIVNAVLAKLSDWVFSGVGIQRFL